MRSVPRVAMAGFEGAGGLNITVIKLKHFYRNHVTQPG